MKICLGTALEINRVLSYIVTENITPITSQLLKAAGCVVANKPENNSKTSRAKMEEKNKRQDKFIMGRF